jgi:hypothetical protein
MSGLLRIRSSCLKNLHFYLDDIAPDEAYFNLHGE